jgi:hypothetical protein
MRASTACAESSMSARFAALAMETYRSNWGSENEQAIRLEDWAWAEGFARRVSVSAPALGAPIPAPCGDGSVHLTWFGPDASRFVLEYKNGRMFSSTRDGRGDYAERELENDEDAINRLIEFVR